MVYGIIRSQTASRKPFRIPLFKRNWSACCAYGRAASRPGLPQGASASVSPTVVHL